MKAVWDGEILAESDRAIEVEGSYYFPPDSVNKKYLKHSSTTSICPWKGKATYFDVVANGKKLKDAAWHHEKPKREAEHIKDYVAFWEGIEIKS